MAANPKTYTIDQVATAARELREAAGVEQERYTGAEVVAALEEEIQILRLRGFSDKHITDLISGFEIEVKPGQLERRSNGAGNIITRLIWGRINSNQMRDDG